MNKRTLLWGVGLGGLGLFALGCSGVGDVSSLSGGKLELKDDMRVAEAKTTKKGLRSLAQPTAAIKAKALKKNEYVIKLRKGAGLPKFLKGSVVKTDNKAINGGFAKLDMKSAAAAYGFNPKNGPLAKSLGLDRTVHIKTKKSWDQVKKLQKNKAIEWVEPVLEMKVAGMKPNDPYYDYQWHMQMLNVQKAWETTKGEGVTVAVIDTGVSAGQDGFLHLAKGYDFVDDDTSPDDGNAHGTHVAGTIAQKANNGVGVVGVAPEATILPVRVLDNNGSGSNTWVANGIVWAVDNGADIINMSLGGPMASEIVADACKYAYEQGVTVVAATGNDGYTDFIGYPAGYPSTIAIGSVDAKKTVAFYSNQGMQIDLVAPGGDVTQDLNGDGQADGVVQETIENGQWGYSFFMGTSMATPHVAGVAALVHANGVTSPDDIRSVLRSTADDLGKSGWDTAYGAGLVNPVKALQGSPGMASADAGPAESEVVVNALSSQRAVIEWKTGNAMPTMVRGTDGTKVRTELKTKLHRVTVSGTPGQKVTYTVNLGKQAGMKKISHTF